LAALGWLVDLLLYDERASKLEEQMLGEDVDELFFFKFLGNSYKSWLAGEDPNELELQDSFSARNKQQEDELAELIQQNQQLEADIQRLKDTPSRVQVLDKKKNDMLKDKDKFTKLIQELRVHIKKLEQKLEHSKTDLENKKKELDSLVYEKTTLEAKFEEQQKNEVDVKRINQEKVQLESNLDSVAASKQKIDKIIWNTEMDISKTYEEVEKLTSAYTTLARAKQLIPQDAKYANGLNFEIKISPNTTLENKKELKQNLINLIDDLRKKTKEIKEQTVDLKEEYEKVEEAVTEKQDSIKALTQEHQKLEQKYLQTKENLLLQVKQSEAEIESIALENSRLKLDSKETLTQRQEALESDSKRYNELSKKCDQERAEFVSDILLAVEIVTGHKTYVNQKLAILLNQAQAIHDRIATDM